MRYLFILCFCLCASCSQQKDTKASFLYAGDVFTEMVLPAPNSVRTGSGAPGHAYWQQQADHDIKASLDIGTNTIIGTERITYHNNSPDTLQYIWLQLEQNVHREDSIRSREGRSTGEVEYEGITISKLDLDGKPAVWQEYATIAKVELDEPMRPNSTVTLDVDWQFKMPVNASMRMGYDDSYEAGPVWELAQWFPTPFVYDDVYGWNTRPYIGRGEFYTNFGDYSVELTVPSNHVVFASGELQNPAEILSQTELERMKIASSVDETTTIRSEEELLSEADGTKTWKYVAEQVRTFAWATSASFIWQAASVEIEQLNGESKRVLCQVGYPEEESHIWDEGVIYLQHAIQYYSRTLYPYPWPQISMTRGKSGGMEYPMLVFCRGRSHESLFNVTDHEVGHNWFPMLINTDERMHAWMDEGFNTFVNHYSLESFYGDREHKPDVPKYIASKFAGDLKPMNTQPDLLKSRGHLSYRKPGYGLRFLREEIMGEERFDAAWNEYIQRWVYKSPRPSDFYRTMEDASGMDLQWFFKGFFEEPMQLDQSIVDVQQMNESVIVIFENLEDWVCPVDVTITSIDGSEHRFKLPVTVWAWSTRHTQTFDVPSPVLTVEIDAKQAYPDINLANNVWVRE